VRFCGYGPQRLVVLLGACSLRGDRRDRRRRVGSPSSSVWPMTGPPRPLPVVPSWIHRLLKGRGYRSQASRITRDGAAADRVVRTYRNRPGQPPNPRIRPGSRGSVCLIHYIVRIVSKTAHRSLCRLVLWPALVAAPGGGFGAVLGPGSPRSPPRDQAPQRNPGEGDPPDGRLLWRPTPNACTDRRFAEVQQL
jgi:hypothetical protein